MSAQILPEPTKDLKSKMRGTWWLLSREDYTKEGQKRIDPVLGSDPIAILAYSKTHFSAQFMKRDRTNESTSDVSFSGQNNTIAVGGYDAYFGIYEVDEDKGKVTHTLVGSINPSNVGISVIRDLRVDEEKLIIQLETTTPRGEAITRTLVWDRLG
jgi:hypothetical protein